MFFIRLYRGAEENRIFHPISEIEKLSVYCSQARALAGALKIRYRVCRFEEDVLGLRQAFSMAKQYDLEFSELEHMADAGACDEYAAGLIKQIRSEWETETLPGSDLGGGPWEKNLSRQERAVLNLIAGGLSNQQIAEKLCIAVATVKTHNYNIFKKLGVSNRMAASQKARHLGLI
jgi:ATP/maltotriose-dependent transcriptional regulator MalT